MGESAASWVPGWETTGFPADALPYGVCDQGGETFVGVAIGEYVLDLAQAARAGLLHEVAPETFAQSSLNRLIGLGKRRLWSLRDRLKGLLRLDAAAADREAIGSLLIPQSAVAMCRPLEVGDFTDFYASEHHALRSMRATHPDASLTSNWYDMPIGYSSRAGSIVGDGANVVRPCGQIRLDRETVFAPSQMVDFEAEIGLVVAADSQHGHPVPVGAAADYLFGVCLLNDWSARDIQRWESRPLGPHLGKSFATQLGPWVLPIEALADAAIIGRSSSRGPLHLRHDGAFLFDIEVEATLASTQMCELGLQPVRVSIANSRDLYWDAAQMIAHVTSNGAPLRAGDLLGTGTISGPLLNQSACLLELTADGRAPLELPDGSIRGYLLDGDQLALRGHVRRRDGSRLAMGCLGATIAPASIPGTTLNNPPVARTTSGAGDIAVGQPNA